ncbi:MAG: peptidase dimerization domain-containing protein, partial [Acidobacteriota bacterium]|nr:peptidase dimerization domain-containing protein [Acidobacteriota bacterium]
IRASEKINVIPSHAELRVDCRVPPGRGEEDVRRGIAEVLGEDGFQIEFTEQMPANRSPAGSPLMDAISAWIAEHDPGARTVPVILPGFSDSRHFRAAFPDCVAYGFFPHRHQSLFETAPLVHGADERIDVRDLAFASQLYMDLARTILG